MEPGHHRPDGNVEGGGDIAVGHALQVKEQNRLSGALPELGEELLETRHLFSQQGLPLRGGPGRDRDRQVVHPGDDLLFPQPVKTEPASDGNEPGEERAVGVEPVEMQKHADKRLLGEILRIPRPEHPRAESVNGPLKAEDELLEGPRVAPAGASRKVELRLLVFRIRALSSPRAGFDERLPLRICRREYGRTQGNISPGRGCRNSAVEPRVAQDVEPVVLVGEVDIAPRVHEDVFRLKGHVLNCDELGRHDGDTAASGFMAPPSRPVTKLFNMAALTSWSRCPERLHAGSAAFRAGFGWETMRYLSDGTTWDADPLRLLHVCFLRRSSRDPLDPEGGRPSLGETGTFRRGVRGLPRRLRYRRYMDPRIIEYHKQGRNWKQEWYRRGERVTVDASPFLDAVVA